MGLADQEAASREGRGGREGAESAFLLCVLCGLRERRSSIGACLHERFRELSTMHTPRFFCSAAFVLLGVASHPVAAADSAAQIHAKLKGGGEVAWLIENSTDKTGDLAVLFAARLKGTKPARFPYLVRGELTPADTDALNAFDESSDKTEDRVTMENIVVSLKEKRVLGRVEVGKPEEELVYFPGRNHGSLEVLWGPEEEGWHFGILNFGGKWESSAVIMVESDGERLRQKNIKPMLDAKANAFIKTALKGKKGLDASRYAVPYGGFEVVDPDVGYSVGNPIKVKLTFDAEVPKAPDGYPEVAGTMTLLLETSRDAISARVLHVGPSKK